MSSSPHAQRTHAPINGKRPVLLRMNDRARSSHGQYPLRTSCHRVPGYDFDEVDREALLTYGGYWNYRRNSYRTRYVRRIPDVTNLSPVQAEADVAVPDHNPN